MHGLADRSFATFLGSGEFLESVFEKWDGEFLEKWAYVFLTAYLVQVQLNRKIPHGGARG